MPKASSSSRPSFRPETLRFLRELAQHNDRPWFQANKARYDSVVQEPALRFIEAMGPRLARISPHVTAEARPFGGSLSRIYRDTRFAKDKSPYKTHVGIHFAHEGVMGKEHLPGFYFHLAPGESLVASGIWRPDPPDAKRIRDAIVASPDRWAKALPKGMALGGEAYARVPAGYDPEHRFADALRQKDFFASLPFEDRVLLRPDFASTFEASCRKLDPLNRFLADALGVPW
jgi:uncharacterized protein (TIGR02453 family)